MKLTPHARKYGYAALKCGYSPCAELGGVLVRKCPTCKRGYACLYCWRCRYCSGDYKQAKTQR